MRLTWAIQKHLSDFDSLKLIEACNSNGNSVIEVTSLDISDAGSR